MQNPPGRRESRGALALAGGLYLAHCAAFWHYVNDDAYITFRYSRSLAQGLGPYFNIGEHVEGYTNFLLMLVLAGVARVAGAGLLPVVAKALGVACGAAALALAWSVTKLVLRDHPQLSSRATTVAAIAAILVALSPSYAVNSTSGLETMLFCFLLMLGVHQGMVARLRGRWAGAGVAFAAAALTRPEAIAVVAVAWTAQLLGWIPLWPKREPESPLRRLVPLLFDGALVLGAVGVHLMFRLVFYDGEWLPNTYYAKTGGAIGAAAWRYVYDGIVYPFVGLPGVAVGLAGALAVSRRQPVFAAVPAVGVFGMLLPFLVGTDWMVGWRFVAPSLPLVATTLAVGWAHVLAEVARVPIRAALLAAVVASAALQAPVHRSIAAETRLRARGYEKGHSTLASWLCGGRAAAGDTIALMDIGIVGFRCEQQTILDISGLTDRFIARSPGRFLAKEYDPRYVLDRDPRFVVLVLATEGTPFREPPADARFFFWTPAEGRLYRHPEFQRRFRCSVGFGSETAEDDWRRILAARFGAVRIFEHAHVGYHYLLAVFEAEPREGCALADEER